MQMYNREYEMLVDVPFQLENGDVDMDALNYELNALEARPDHARAEERASPGASDQLFEEGDEVGDDAQPFKQGVFASLTDKVEDPPILQVIELPVECVQLVDEGAPAQHLDMRAEDSSKTTGEGGDKGLVTITMKNGDVREFCNDDITIDDVEELEKDVGNGEGREEDEGLGATLKLPPLPDLLESSPSSKKRKSESLSPETIMTKTLHDNEKTEGLEPRGNHRYNEEQLQFIVQFLDAHSEGKRFTKCRKAFFSEYNVDITEEAIRAKYKRQKRRANCM